MVVGYSAAIARGRLPPWISGKVMSPPAISLTRSGVLSAVSQRVNKSRIRSDGMKSLIGCDRLILLRQTHCRSADRASPDPLNRIPRRLSGLLPGLVLCTFARGA